MRSNAKRYWISMTLMFFIGAVLALFFFGRAIANGKGADLRGSAIIFPYAMAVFWFTYNYAPELTWIVLWPLPPPSVSRLCRSDCLRLHASPYRLHRGGHSPPTHLQV